MIEKEKNKYSSLITNNAKNEKFREKLKTLLPLIFDLFFKLTIKKVKIFKKQSKNLKMMKTMNLIIH